MPRLALFTLLAATLFGPAAQAARPLLTDDAGALSPGGCQLETWFKGQSMGNEFWVIPACAPTDWLEIAAGRTWLLDEEGRGAGGDSSLLQLKTLFKPLDDDWGVGLVIGALSREHEPSDLLGSTYVYTPISLMLAEGLPLHFNPGWQRERDSGRSAWTWSLGAEFDLAPRIQGVAESFGEEGAGAYAQIGLRFFLAPDRVQIDASWGRRLNGGGEDWWTLGLRLFDPSILY
ncbi:MAG: hypothetical protein ACOZAQ_03415 [Pseudomonadota bacterium]